MPTTVIHKNIYFIAAKTEGRKGFVCINLLKSQIALLTSSFPKLRDSGQINHKPSQLVAQQNLKSMITLKGTSLFLRALEPEDLEFVHAIENDENIWNVSNTQTPYSKFLIRHYLENANQDIFEAKQLRLAICKNNTEKAIGLIDLFDFDPRNNRAGIGIIIQDLNDRGQGYGSESLQLLINYSFKQLNLHQLYANIGSENETSLKLFSTFGFINCGVKKDWNLIENSYQDEALFQLINPFI